MPVQTKQDLFPVFRSNDIAPAYRNNPIGDLFAYHNLGALVAPHKGAKLLVATCIDHRVRLRMPRSFAYVIRTPGVNLEGLDFAVSFSVALGGVRAIALIGHEGCGMVNLPGRRERFVEGLMQVGWSERRAVVHFDREWSQFGIMDPCRSVCSTATSLRKRFPGLIVAPLMYRLEDGMLCQIGRDIEDAGLADRN